MNAEFGRLLTKVEEWTYCRPINMRVVAVILILVEMIIALAAIPALAAYVFRRSPGFGLGVLIGSPIWMMAALQVGYLAGGFGEAALGTEIGVPIGLFIGMVGGSVSGVLVSGFVASILCWLIKAAGMRT